MMFNKFKALCVGVTLDLNKWANVVKAAGIKPE
jgi:hypothetical protein